jgi:hypothetical protein
MALLYQGKMNHEQTCSSTWQDGEGQEEDIELNRKKAAQQSTRRRKVQKMARENPGWFRAELMKKFTYSHELMGLVNRDGVRISKPVCAYGTNRVAYSRMYTLGGIWKEHHLVWLILKGQWPCMIMDHVNGVPTDNRIDNLRLVTNRGNCHNLPKHRAGGLVGAIYSNRRGYDRWRSEMRINGKGVYLGLFRTEIEAHQAYMKKLSELSEL